MNTQTVIPTPQAPPPTVVLSRLLLTETCSVTRTVDPGNVAPEALQPRATKATAVRRDTLEHSGHPHGGINE